MRLLLLAVILNAPCSMFNVFGQIKIGGNVYGGGNEGEVLGSTKVTVLEGDIGVRPADSDEPLADPLGKVFGGARMANVRGNTYVNIDGANASGYIVINQVYGGNDISGTIGTAAAVGEALPGELITNNVDGTNKHGVDNTWNAYVHISTKTTTTTTGEGENAVTTKEETEDAQKIYIGQVFAGGNGDFTYTDDDGYPLTDGDGNFIVKSGEQIIATSKTPFSPPVLQKTYLDVQGGSIVYAYGGGNNVTIEKEAVIHVDNPSKVVNHVYVDVDGVEDPNATEMSHVGLTDLLTNARFRDMGINTYFSKPSSDEFQIGSFYGGNNKADMAIRPTWHLQDGMIRNLYSGGNRGRMIYEKGIFLEIPELSTLVVDNLYGGCRMADVRPMRKDPITGKYEDVEEIYEKIGNYNFPNNLAARVLVAGGDINNVYGGNDVRGKVYFGSAVGIHTSVRGNVYGGGNGAYPYTDNEYNANHPLYGDFYYNSSMEALNAIRPNAEQVSILVIGKDAAHPTIIKGSIYVGGNCATLKADPNHAGLNMGTSKTYPLTELKIGSHVIAENVFLGNNGEEMVDEEILKLYANIDPETGGYFNFSSMNLKDDPDFPMYMEGVALSQIPSLVVVDETKGDGYKYDEYTSYIGSLFYGSNRGSMTYSGPINITPNAPIYIYNKVVAGCNHANIPASDYNARYEGGILGSADERGEGGYMEGGKIKDRVVMNLSKIRLKPMRLNSEGTGLEWNTVKWADSYIAVADGTTLTAGDIYYTSDAGGGKFTSDGTEVADATHQYYTKTSGYIKTETGSGTGAASDADLARRLLGGNIYGGCYESGHVNGNVVINLNGSLLDRHEIFDAFAGEEDGDNILYDRDSYTITARKSGVILNEQGMDVLGDALSVYGGGKGAETEIWGSATVNINKGYTFQVFGGSENGVIGKGTWQEGTLNTESHIYEGGKYIYPTIPDEAYSTFVNLSGVREGVSRAEDSTEEMADVEFIYGGGNNGLIVGNTRVNLDNGRLFNLFAGSCNADILGHTETYVGLNGFPYLRDHIYGGNDLGGEIKGSADFTDKVSEQALPMVHADSDGKKDVLKANTYVEYRKGRMKHIFGGCFGDYDYNHDFTEAKGYSFPKLDNAFVNFCPNDNSRNHVDKVFGAGEGYPGDRHGDKMQNRSYVLVDIADNKSYYANTEVFGGGNNNGLGMGFGKDGDNFITFASDFNLDRASAIIDLVRGQVGAAYGGSYNEGITRRSVVNVPEESTIKIGSIFGGAYGTKILPPCDVYESNVYYRNTSENARVSAIYGGNNNERRTLYARVYVSSPVWSDKDQGYLATVYGAGKGIDTWAEYTEVNLLDGAKVYEVYGGGQMGHVLNAESIQKYMQMYKDGPSAQIRRDDPDWGKADRWTKNNQNEDVLVDDWKDDWLEVWKDAWAIGEYYDPVGEFIRYVGNAATNLSRVDARTELDAKTAEQLGNTGKKYNTNVIINQGATVVNYAYGGGLGDVKVERSGDVYGTTYITLLGGTVNKDIYASGTAGGVYDIFGVKNFTASANAYIKGGMVRNVYGGGWRGSVGYHPGLISGVNTNDVLGQSNVVIGDLAGESFLNGIPAILRNVYGGGEGGGIFGDAHVYVNNGRIGYRYKNNEYVPELDDVAEGDNLLLKSGNVFGGGYVANSYVDHSNIEMYDGIVRGSLYGGGEVGPIGRGTMKTDAPGTATNGNAKVYKPGTTRLEMYGGHVLRNVFGGGRGRDNWDGDGYMTNEEKLTMDLSAKGYVFGQTTVHIHGGEIGTENGLAENSGNVFGGGDYGFVYSAYEKAGAVCYGKKSGVRYNKGLAEDNPNYGDEGYYYKYENGAYVVSDGEKIPTEDCKVLIEPYTKVLTSVTLDKTYSPGEYVPIDVLNTLKNKKDDASKWNCLDPTGIIIHNAVFAGGNTVEGSIVNANTVTVYGNATASIHDIYHRDLITLGTNYVGGLYGDGNLTLVDGYRGLNITNYGTDYYSIDKEIDINTYKTLPAREAAYYELKYKCLKACTDKDGTRYNPKDESNENSKASTINADDMLVLFMENNGQPVKVDATGNRILPEDHDTEGTTVLVRQGDKWVPNADYWKESGVLPIYAGRLMNSIQRADFCGVFGSRMVMRGAQDRVPETADFTNYTINRVREVSLNQQHSVIADDLVLKTRGTSEDEDPDNYEDLDKAIHGNYFGIYNIVNYLGALTSDVHFRENEDKRRTSNTNITYASTDDTDNTYYKWKSKYIKERKRNNGTSLNKVALASGVYLELTTEKGTGDGLWEKDWGYITGVIELDLINVQTGIGGGFVYAKNEHGKPDYTPKKHATLTELNKDAVTRKDYTYSTSDLKEWETSGNFVHSTQTIIDDCYNVSGKYKGDDAVPAHYWYIKGQVYVYDQYISAYTGAPNAYRESVDIPLTITAASHGTMKLLNVQPNRYAFYSSPGVPLALGKKVNINDVEYSKNDPISYWDWSLLSNTEKELFVEKTYVTNDSCKIGDQFYPRGYVMLPEEYKTLKDVAKQPENMKVLETGDDPVPSVQKATKDENGVDVVVKDNDGNIVYRAFDYVFRESNNLRHNTGYILSYKVNNPLEWDTWYTPKLDSDGSKIDYKTYKELSVDDKSKYEDGPTYRLNNTTTGSTTTGALLGQHHYKVGDVISEDVVTTYDAIDDNLKPTDHATFVNAHIVTKQITVPDEDGGTHHLNPGSTVSAPVSGYTEPAYICTSTVILGDSKYIYIDTKMSKTEYDKYIEDYPSLVEEIKAKVVPAYYCTVAGPYGGNYYESGKNYRGLEAWSSLSEDDRKEFTFNYDALDLLIDDTFGSGEGEKYQYDSKAATLLAAKENPAGYSLDAHVNYTATNEDGVELSRAEFEDLANEQRHYTPISPTAANDYKVYVVNTPFLVGNSPYAVGQTLSAAEWSGLGDNQAYVTVLTFSQNDKDTYYYCREAYTIDNTDKGHAVKSINGITGTYAKGQTVPLGAVINKTEETEGYTGYSLLTNEQKNYTIHGVAPTETSTLFVSRESDIFDLSTEKIITVVYQYDYEETDTEGNATPVSERHVVNIHINFKSGVPNIEDIRAPQIVIPGDYISMISPHVSEGAYEVTDYGWELFEKIDDAESHTNGVEFTPDTDPLYWYQDGHYVAYYAKTYLGKTYSNHVPVSVANYHDLKKVMEAKKHHYYVDDPNVKREPKIYINDYSQDETGSKNGLDLLKSLFDLSVLDDPELNTEGFINSGDFKDHKPLGTQVRAARNLEFFLKADIDHGPTTKPDPEHEGETITENHPWTPIANGNGECFEGTLHGDGHTISGLTPAEGTTGSLFNHLCGNVYNLGVTGSFTGAGVADTGDGYVENCWVKTSATEGFPIGEDAVRAVFGKPTATSDTKQIVNCYYPEPSEGVSAYYSTTDTDNHGLARQMPGSAFYNGEVAYDLNGFYLYKRYNDNATPDGATTYKYWLTGNDTPQEGRYAENKSLCSSGYNNIKYVEDRFADGDFIYAGGSVPTTDDKRLYTYTVTEASGNDKIVRDYYPIWPDDYLFFGQKLTYGHIEGSTHQDLPDSYTTDNRVYRAPAYFRSSEMKVAHFNPDAVFAQTKNGDANVIAYKNMTAIDFTGYNDVYNGETGALKNYTKGNEGAHFYDPLLDDGGLTSFTNVDLTKNLLVYTGATAEIGSDEPLTAAQMTASVVGDYLGEPVYSESADGYRSVAYQNSGNIHGHWVENGKATRNHFLVDKQDFNAPIEYTFAADRRMWYQRQPEPNEYVDRMKGWQGISLPFTAELVTTHQKGEITHFYSGSYESKNETHTKIGHEYWLREFTGIDEKTENGVTTAVASLTYPNSADEKNEKMNKTVSNTFLWDYYYQGAHNQEDYRHDTYQDYYSTSRQYGEYPLLTGGKPYLLGLPGMTYYEFDLSGNFEATTTTTPNPVKLSAQIITFASVPGTTIHVSDGEMAGVEKTNKSKTKTYTFKPNYLNETFKAGSNNYTLEAEYDSNNDGTADCSRFGKVPAEGDAIALTAFRPYFVSAGSSTTRSIIFSNEQPEEQQVEEEHGDPTEGELNGSLNVWTKKDKIYVQSSLSFTEDLRIVTPAGVTVATFSVKPGQKVEVQADFSGIYVVHTLDGKYIKKVAVKRE